MITVQQAMAASEFHLDAGCRQGGKVYKVRRNGNTQRWKRQPERFRVPVKHGLYTYGDIDNYSMCNAELFHTAEDCPKLKVTK